MRGKFFRTIASICFVLVVGGLLFFNIDPLNKVLNFFEEIAYDLELRHTYKPVGKEAPVLIVDIDDQSLQAVGSWPWSRDVLARLTDKLYQMGATVVAFDFTFPSADKNVLSEVMHVLEKTAPQDSKTVLTQLEAVKPAFDFDGMFAKSLESGNAVLGCVLKVGGEEQGLLPSPFLTLPSILSEQLLIPNMQSYIGNTPILQCAAKNGGFLNASPGPDGVNRFAPLVLRKDNELYPSLALEAVRVYLMLQKPELLISNYGETCVLEGVKLDQWIIPTDPWGRILIPFRGPVYSLPYISAIDVLESKIKDTDIGGKLVFIGSSATAMGDLAVTAIAPMFPGVEIHTSIALGIMEHYLPYKPAWSKGVSVSLVLLIGLVCAGIFPYLGPLKMSSLFLSLSLLLIYANHWVWKENGLVLSVIAPIFILAVLYLLNLIMGFLFETKEQRKMKSVFSQYLPKERIELLMSQKEGKIGLQGESKELTVLFADIRDFVKISESMAASELKQFLSFFLTPMTEIIFKHKGTIDKYVGDMVMAFWGAPLEDPSHAFNAISAALDMKEKLKDLNLALKSLGKPEISIGIGLNTGIMSVGDMGSKFRRAYTVLGDPVNLASRLENLTKYYHVGMIVGEKTQLETKTHFIYRKLDRVKVKGKENAQEIYELIAPLGKVSSEELENLKMHEKGLSAYFNQEWDQAADIFQELALKDRSSELLYRLYLERIDFMRKSPKKAEWDGIFVFETK